jgi:hypothetical protein
MYWGKLISVVATSTLLIACSGGAGNPESSSGTSSCPTFTGKKDTAVLTVNNQDTFVSAFYTTVIDAEFGIVLSYDSSVSGKSFDSRTMKSFYRQLVTLANQHVAESRYQSKAVDKTEACDAGGSFKVSGSLDDVTNTGTLQLTFSQCTWDINAMVTNLNGTVNLSVNKFDTVQQEITNAKFSTCDFSMMLAGKAYSMSGDEQYTFDPVKGGFTVVSNMFHKASGGQQVLAENLTANGYTCDGVDSGYVAGKICEGANGCVALTTPVPFKCLGDVDTQGELLMSGAGNSKLRLYNLGQDGGTLWVDLDADGDGVYESTKFYDFNLKM